MRQWVFLVSVMIVLAGCNKGDGNGDKTVAAPLPQDMTLEDFDVSYLSLTKTQFISELQSLSDYFFYALEPDPSTSVYCLNAALSPYTYVKNAEGSYDLTMPFIDIADCSGATEGLRHWVSVAVEKKLAVDDLGAPFDLEGRHFMNDLDYTTLQRRQLIVQHISGTLEGFFLQYTSKLAFTDYADFYEPCNTEYHLHCTMRLVDDAVYDGYPYVWQNQKVVLVYNITTSDNVNATYFNSGTITFQINDWNGTMTYTGPETVPTYTATNGDEIVNGTYPYSEQ